MNGLHVNIELFAQCSNQPPVGYLEVLPQLLGPLVLLFFQQTLNCALQ